ncbi:MAG: response regulator transcription factor [Ferruginibacter sp.]|nr:response regulator transcription factor [Chitinophagaceae bacterium]
MINIAIAEDNNIALNTLKEKLSAFPDIILKHTAKNGKEAIENIETSSEIDILLMDIEMPEMNGIDATEIIKKQYPQVKIVMITIYDDDDYIFNAIKAGADSYILKDTKAEKIYETITDTLNGGSVMSPSIAIKALQLLKNAAHIKYFSKQDVPLLSDRETEILEQLSKGHTNKNIAENLFISPFTVKRHIENIYKKLQAQNRIELIEKARREGLI